MYMQLSAFSTRVVHFSYLVNDGESVLFAARSISLHAPRGADRGSEHPRGSTEEGRLHPEERERSAQRTEIEGGRAGQFAQEGG